MKTKSYIASSGIVSIILVIVGIVSFVNYLRDRYMEIFHINYLWDNNLCSATDEAGKEYIDKENGSIYGKDDLYSIEYCAFHPLMLTDPKFKESALTLYGGISKLLSTFIDFFNEKIKVPDTSLPSKNPVLANMILNPWYTSDDAFFTNVEVKFTPSLNVFIIDGKSYYITYNDTSGKEGLFMSFYKTKLNYNQEKLRECNNSEKVRCRNSPLDCPCQNMDVQINYLYTSNDNIIELPMRLYLGMVDEKDTKTIKIKVGGKSTDKVVQPLKVNKLADLEKVLTDNFIGFKNIVKKDCEGIIAKSQKAYDSKCKFFSSDALSGLVIALKRIIVRNIPEKVSLEYKEGVDKIIKQNRSLNYMQFFLWLAIRAVTEKLTFTFVPFKQSK
jgi:hypothetical protein